MNLTEAVHVQILIDWLTMPGAATRAQTEVARDAAALLADGAHLVAHAGPTSAQVLLCWPDLLRQAGGAVGVPHAGDGGQRPVSPRWFGRCDAPTSTS
jgi:hypothetical protein